MKYSELKVMRLHEEATIPTYAHDGDAGLDLYALNPCDILSGGRALVETGIAIDIPLGYVGLIHPRSGLAAKKGLTVLNAPGTVDAGYRGEIKVILVNHNPYEYAMIERGDRIAQLVIQEVVYADVREVESFEGFTARETAGFGSTGA